MRASAFALVLVVACGGKLDTGDGGTDASASDGHVATDVISPPVDFCGGQAAREEKCNLKPSACLHTCFENAIRPEAIGALESCLVALPCSGDDQTCADQVGQPYEDDPEFVSFQKDCTVALKQCPMLNSRWCGSTGALFSSNLRSSMNECFFVNGPCDSMINCVDATITNDSCTP